MTTLSRRPLAAVGAVAALALVLSACGGSGDDTAAEPDGDVTITVGDLPTAANESGRTTFLNRVEEFEKANPGITVDPVETVWDAQTFQANVAGGTLPDVLKVPFTEIQSLIGRGQVADITDAMAEVGVADTINPQTVAVARDADGRDFGVPVAPYAIGLFYNRDLFTQAGLDPDAPPQTWDEVRAAAKAIADATGKAGYAQMTTDNTGGWMLAAQTYSMGGSLEDEKGGKVTFDDEPTRQALEYLQQMRWDDASMGSTVLYDMTSIAEAFAAGDVGMFLSVPSASYAAAVNNYGMARESIGVASVPEGPGSDGSVLAGGSVAVVNPTASEAEKEAAVRWVDFYELRQYSDQDVAVSAAQASRADGGNVGIPRIPPVRPELYQEYLGWIADEINVPQEYLADYADGLDDLTLRTEPVSAAQEVYALLDTVVQQVLTEQGADIDALLATAADTAQTRIERSAR